MDQDEPVVVRENFSKNYSAAGQCAKKLWQNDTLQRRAVSGMWSLDSYDPFQIFQVKQRECHILKVFVEKAYNISKGWLGDLVDKPDPYLILSVPGTPNGKKHTKTIDNSVNPVWEQEFEFYLDPDDVYQLEIVVMDANYTKDGEMDRVLVPLDDLEGSAGKDSKDYVATLSKGAKIILKLELSKNNAPDIRYSLALSDEEKSFLRMRREVVMDSINKLMPEDGPGRTNEVPMIGLLGSGGGFRALIALSGACTALQDEGIFDCLAYVAGLSGSSWYLSYLYAQPEFPEKPLSYFQPKLREAISKNWKTLLFTKFLHYSRQLINKKTKGQPVSFTDLFGHLVGETLLGAELKNSTLSEQRRCLDKAQMPMPLYTCVNVKKNVSARVFQDWFEFTPYEVGVAKYGAFMKPESFGSKYYVGKIVKQFPEYPLHFLQGVWGSAFCKLIKWHIRGGEKNINLADFTSTSDEKLANFKTDVDELIKNRNSRSSAQLEKEIECNSDDDVYQDAISDEVTDSIKNPISKELESDSSDELESDTDEDEKREATPKLERRGALKRPSTGKAISLAPNSWKERKRTIRQKRREEQENFWNRSLQAIFCSEMLDTREGRAGMIFNPLRGLNLENTFDISPFNPTTPEDDTDFMGLYEPTNINAKKLYLVDSGLTFNSPFPLLLRPQRAVDLYLSFDFSTRAKDDDPPFKQLIVAEKWANLNHVPFPQVEKQVANFKEEEELREWYVFENPDDLQCPTILHFVIYNKTFREFKEPGVRRETQEELDFANFEVFGEETPYTILNFCYTHEQFDRLSKLMEFNTKLGMPEIKAQIKKAVERRRKLAEHPRQPIALSRLPSIRRKTKQQEYERYMSLRMSMESENEIFEEAPEG